MKKIFLALILTVSGLARAENWVQVAVGQSGNQLIMDRDSWTILPHEKLQNEFNIFAKFKFINSDNSASDVFVYSTTLLACERGNGQVHTLENTPDKGWIVTNTMWFAFKGDKAFDFGAKSLCTIYVENAEKLKKNTPKPTPQKQNSTRGTSV